MPDTTPAAPARVYLGVGSNLAPRRHVPGALRALEGVVRVDGVATCLFSDPVGRPEQPRYLNTVFTGLTPLAPRALRVALRDLERGLGRRRTADRYASRPIDLDIVLYGDRVIADGPLRIPDPDLRTRAFVALPVLELAPELRLPDTGERLADVAAALSDRDLVPAPQLTAALRAALPGLGIPDANRAPGLSGPRSMVMLGPDPEQEIPMRNPSDGATDWTSRRCKPCEGGVPPMGEAEITEHLQGLDGWAYRNGALARTYKFKNYYRTMAFVNAVAWLSHQQDHHPELVVNYKTCEVRYRTHSIGGLSENDFICAAKADRLLE